MSFSYKSTWVLDFVLYVRVEVVLFKLKSLCCTWLMIGMKYAYIIRNFCQYNTEHFVLIIVFFSY